LGWIDRVLAPDQVVEVRSFRAGSPPKSRLFRPDQRQSMARHVSGASIAGCELYFTLNPLRLDLDKPARDADVERRLLILIDCDPARDPEAMRAAGDGAKLSSTEIEKAHARDLAVRVRDHLASLGWPDPIEADSGNGYHLLYAVELPNDDRSRDLIRGALRELARRFDTAEASIDTKVFNSSRITKFYGTVARKGVATPDRPHRPSAILAVPDDFRRAVVTVDQLTALAPPEPAPLIRPDPQPRDRREDGRWTPEARAVAYLLKCEAAVSGEKGHDKAYKAACKVGPGFDLAPDVALRLLKEVWNPHCRPPWSDAELLHKITDAYSNEPRRGWLKDQARHGSVAPNGSAHARRNGVLPPPDPVVTDPPERTPVEINTRRYEVVERSVAALAERDPDIYKRANALVTVVQEEDDVLRLTVKTEMKGVAGSPKILHLSDAVVGDRLTRACEFFKWVRDKNGEELAAPAHPPEWLIRTVATRKYWPGIRPLVAVSECPYPRPDGSIVEESGYDKATAVLYMPSIEFLPIPLAPTRDEARAAAARILSYFEYFPFASEDDRSVVLAGIVNVVARHGVVGPMPGVAVSGNKPSTGKGYIVNGMVIPGTGRPAPATKYPHDDVEAGKVKTSVVRSGKTVVSFDNLAEGGNYGGPDIDSLITALTTDDRILGLSENTGDLVVRICAFVNGNNISPVKDAYRRWLVCNLITALEHPERRDDIRQELPFNDLMIRDRPSIVRDVLTILRSHALAGRPTGGWAPLGSFEEWDSIVRGSVWYATGRDCVATQFRAAEDSQDRRDRIALLEGLRELPGGRAEDNRGVTMSEAIEIVKANPNDYQTLRGFLAQRGRGGQLAEPRTVGKILSGMLNSINGGLRLLKHPMSRHGSAAWMVERVGSPEPPASDAPRQESDIDPGVFDNVF
jgi:putative DNA primase/helicase